jgi:hypothetical protein
MDGMWFPDEGSPLPWCYPFPLPVHEQIVIYDNPTGKLTNLDLELVETVMHQAILGEHAKVDGETAHTLCGNTPSIAWQAKGSNNTTKLVANLLQVAAFIPQEQRCNHRINHILGDDNRMGDDGT